MESSRKSAWRFRGGSLWTGSFFWEDSLLIFSPMGLIDMEAEWETDVHGVGDEYDCESEDWRGQDWAWISCYYGGGEEVSIVSYCEPLGLLCCRGRGEPFILFSSSSERE